MNDTADRERCPLEHCGVAAADHPDEVRRLHAAYARVGPRCPSGEGVGHWSSTEIHRAVGDVVAGSKAEAAHQQEKHKAETNHEAYVSDKRAAERDKAERSLLAEREKHRALVALVREAEERYRPTWGPAEDEIGAPAGWTCQGCGSWVKTEDDETLPDMDHDDDCIWETRHRALADLDEEPED